MTFPRMRALIFVAVLFVTAGVVVLTAINRDTQTQPPVDPCEPGEVRANIAVPDPGQVTINVFNGTNRVNLAQQIGGEFTNRGFVVSKTETAPEPFSGVAKITYGPAAVGSAWLVSAYFLADEYEGDFQLARAGSEVDVTLGDQFEQLATSTEVNQAIAANGKPKAPAGTCAA
jgi:LytR cell envelope-related transcriptional attenuator